MKLMKKFLFVTFSIFVATNVMAQYEIKKYSINSGGSFMTSNSYSLKTSTGQVDANSKQTGGNYTLNAGFWHNSVTTPLTEIIFNNGFE